MTRKKNKKQKGGMKLDEETIRKMNEPLKQYVPLPVKSKTTLVLLNFFLGYLGIDRFYIGDIGIGLLKLFTGGVFGILQIIDFIRITINSISKSNSPIFGDNYDWDLNSIAYISDFEFKNGVVRVYCVTWSEVTENERDFDDNLSISIQIDYLTKWLNNRI